MATPLIQISGLEKAFTSNESWLSQWRFRHGKLTRHKDSIHALNGVNLTINQGETLCVVGETGCGKSTLARAIMGLTTPSAGEIHYLDQRIDQLNNRQRMFFRRRMQMVFQNPYASLNPRMTVYQTLSEPISFHNPQFSQSQVDEKIDELLESVGISASSSDRYPHEFSGGQRQRISLARALSVEPDFIVADEPLSALDVSVQAQVLNLMMDKQEERNLSYLFITHDLAVVEHFATRVAVMYLGRICELAPTGTLFSAPKHPYTQALLSAIPRLDSNTAQPIRLIGEVPTPTEKPIGCVFQARCPYANQRCYEASPAMTLQSDGSSVACHAIEEGRL
ncbi:ABC transporter ATP-binding protein [Marinomonas sp. UCMA 3892]|jgi:peptide/nickel transport system ATP-binding protein|uniref:Peptide/nickel transport system ATP-binding protein n=2 Tax=Marinomonas TaxID=28253 RepID=A0A1M4TR23_9GAMM|nr:MULTISPECIES: oligopeptide/dipeptide ABC transporter ATP-binding protein [Marinomonas]MBU1294254.1 ATP-binding cassette domain-containing protein [Gammaproteobacteria bacterium]MBU1466291.1 ATP-binding cassette domain-containing protein [Gammaproteobacteria bacterium]MBU2022457.1 ATP-binding cassette domain-containing protein [Gammaproteobacteria bacterium]MBU2237854.1 ATP-binding cassette domain-containing protein [Gammaproteobacteria bacterium]MBU2317449.1 ATP-binding cassette domain-cont|tara:strand:+ start:5596 stop:6606 length:1011 start_codon:yes stop_codon:yes gene_type:complete